MTSRMIPRESIDVLRGYVDIALDAIGIDCTLYIPTNTSFAVAEKKDIYAVPADYEYISYTAKIFIDWTPNIWKLKKLGLFLEDTLPILCWLGNKATALEGSEVGTEVTIDVCIRSYFRIEPEFIPEKYMGVEEFEIVNVASKKMQDALIRQIFSAVPRRVEV